MLRKTQSRYSEVHAVRPYYRPQRSLGSIPLKTQESIFILNNRNDLIKNMKLLLKLPYRNSRILSFIVIKAKIEIPQNGALKCRRGTEVFTAAPPLRHLPPARRLTLHPWRQTPQPALLPPSPWHTSSRTPRRRTPEARRKRAR